MNLAYENHNCCPILFLQWAELLLSAEKQRYQTLTSHSVKGGYNGNKFSVFSLFSWMELQEYILFLWQGIINDCLYWIMHMMAINKSNLYNKMMRQSSSSTETCYVCIHIETFLKSKETGAQRWLFPLIYNVHLSLTHKLQNRDWMLWCQSKTCNYKLRCFMISRHCCYGDETAQYTVWSLWQKNSISFSRVHTLRQNWCSTGVLHDEMENTSSAVEKQKDLHHNNALTKIYFTLSYSLSKTVFCIDIISQFKTINTFHLLNVSYIAAIWRENHVMCILDLRKRLELCKWIEARE